MKKSILFFMLVIAAGRLRAQTDFNYQKFAIGAGVSYIRGYTNVNIQDNHFAENVNFSYYYDPYIPISFEIQKGLLSGGSVTLDPYGRQYSNNYIAAMIHGDFQLGFLIDAGGDASLNLLKGFYVGTGAGFIKDANVVQRTSPADPNYIFPGTDNSTNLMVPLRIGYEFSINDSFGAPFIRLVLSYEHNLVFGEGLDGYDDPAGHFKNNSIDQYRQISFGIKVNFGGSTGF